MKTIAVIDDDIHIGNFLEELLQREGYAVIRAYSGTEAVLLLERTRPDLVLLDLMLPGITGEELIPVFSPKTPVIVISAKNSLDSKVSLLSAGAEDYLCKPFDLPELLVRIQVQLRRQAVKSKNPEAVGTERIYTNGGRSGQGETRFPTAESRNVMPESVHGKTTTMDSRSAGTAANNTGTVPAGTKKNMSEDINICNNVYHYREWTLDVEAMELTASRLPVILTRHEFLILELFIRNPRRVFSKQMIYEYVWGEEYMAEDKTINVHISNIRSKLKASGTDSYIQTVWGMGFKLT